MSLSGSTPGLAHREIGKHVPARRIDIAEGEALAFQILQRMDRCARLGDQKRVELLVLDALDERNDAVAGMRLKIGQAAEIGDVQGAVAQPLHRRIVVRRNDEFDGLAGHLFEIGAQRRLVFDGELGRAGIRNHPDPQGRRGQAAARERGHDERAQGCDTRAGKTGTLHVFHPAPSSAMTGSRTTTT